MSSAQDTPKIVAFSAPSGAGKSTICNILLQSHQDIKPSVSATTRPARFYEREGEHYYFLSEATFMSRVEKGDFLEYEKVHGNFYGTLKESVENHLANGFSVLFDIDVNGALAIKKHYPEAILIFITPPSEAALRERLKGRGSDSDEEINKRLKRLPEEMEKGTQFDYIVVNSDLDETVREIEDIIFGK